MLEDKAQNAIADVNALLPLIVTNALNAFAAIVILLIARRWRQRLLHSAAQVGIQLLSYRQRPSSLLGALLSSISRTLCNVASLYFCLLALNVHLSFIQVLIAFTVGVTLGTITPTPGGLGGVEAGLIAGLVAYRVSGADALVMHS